MKEPLDESVFVENELRKLHSLRRGMRGQVVVRWTSKQGEGATTVAQWRAWSNGLLTSSPRGDSAIRE